MFEAVWPNRKKKIDVVVSNLEKHGHLMRDEVTLLDIKEAQEARVLALANFTEIHEFQDTQKFQGLKARISPPLHDERLDWLRNRSHTDGAKWLLRDQTFAHWLEVSKRDITWLWLQGIPGSGKTYLAAAAINHAKKNYQTIFIFASHTNQKTLTALSVIQSLIFQAVVDKKDLQTVLVESSERDLNSNTSYASDLLKSLLVSAGPTYIVIDGLDEMEESEQQILLQKLETVVKDCNELKILICSRVEDNITQSLAKKARFIRVDRRNLGSIQGYINTRSQEWMDNCNFDVGTKSEVIRLLSSLSACAKGR
jgi:nucleoside-triphosphatase THEP1